MAGLLTGIMLARPSASVVADVAGWRAVFCGTASVMFLIVGWLGIAFYPGLVGRSQASSIAWANAKIISGSAAEMSGLNLRCRPICRVGSLCIARRDRASSHDVPAGQRMPC